MLQRLSFWNEAAYSDIVETIYAAPFTSNGWVAVLDTMRELFGLSFASSVRRSVDRQNVEGVASGVTDDDYQGYMRTYFQGSLFGRDPRAGYAGKIDPARTMIPHAIFQSTEMYQEYWRPRDLSDALHVGVSLDMRENYHYLSLVRPPNAEPHQAADIALIRPLLPHLKRASELEQKLRQAAFLATTGLSALDFVDHAVLLLDATGALAHANAAAERLLAAEDGLRVEQGALCAANAGLTARLQKLLSDAGRPAGAGAKAGAIRLPSRIAAPALTLLAVPFLREAHWTLPNAPRILVCISNPAQHSLPAPELIKGLFGLTDREAWLAAELLAGQKLTQIAASSGRSVNTLRTQMANLLAKTNVSRQSELMRLLASLPRLPG